MPVQDYQCHKCIAYFQEYVPNCPENKSQIKCPQCGSTEVDVISPNIMDAGRSMPGFGVS